MIRTLDAVMGPPAFAATVAVIDEGFLENRGDMVVNIVMNDPVAEVGGKNLSFDRLVDNEADAGLRLVAPLHNLIT